MASSAYQTASDNPESNGHKFALQKSKRLQSLGVIISPQ
jgi:hypothetical protein